MPYGPAGADKAAAEQKLLDTAMERYPHLFTVDRLWLMDRNFPGAARIADPQHARIQKLPTVTKPGNSH